MPESKKLKPKNDTDKDRKAVLDAMPYREYIKTPEGQKYLEKRAKELEKAMQPQVADFFKMRDTVIKNFAEQAKQIEPVIKFAADAHDAISAAASSATEISKVFEAFKKSRQEPMIIPRSALMSPESRLEITLNKIYEKLDKDSGGAKMEAVKDKIAYCRFCSKMVMKVVDFSYFLKGTMKCIECDKVLRIPEDLNFKDTD